MSGLPQGGRSVAVIAALAVELRPLRRMRRKGAAASALRLIQSGPGLAASRAAAERAAVQGASALVSWGLAGGLDAELAPGTVVVTARVVSAAGELIHGDAGWSERLTATLPAAVACRTGLLLSSDLMLETPAAKAAAAGSGAVAVDMETHGIATVAARHALPWIAVRTIVDAAADPLPCGLAACVDQGGNTRLVGVISVLLRPAQWPGFARIVLRQRCANRSLTRVASHLATAGCAAPAAAPEPG